MEAQDTTTTLKRIEGFAGPLKYWSLSLLIWSALLLLFATQNWVAFRNAGQDLPWLEHVVRELPGWGMWAFLAPLALMAAQRLPVVGRHRIRNFVLHLFLAGFFLLLHITLYMALLLVLPLRPDVQGLPLTFAERIMLGLQSNFAFFIFIYGAVVVISHLLESRRSLQAQELQASQLSARLAQAHLDLLRMQLQPHFLFNTLHSISALMAKDVPAARHMMASLSDLLRLSIDRDEAREVKLAEELDFLRRYLEIQKMRFGERLCTELDAAPNTLGLLVPPLLLQPLVENAIQHGIAKRAGRGHIRVRAEREGGSLCLSVEDDGPGLGSSGIREGVGLGNTRARLEGFYGNAHCLTLTASPTGGVSLKILIPARREAGAA